MKYVKFFATFVACLIMFYLMGSFAAADFNIATWEPALRTFLALFGTFAACVVASVVIRYDILAGLYK